MEVDYDIVKREAKTLKDLPPREEYKGGKEELLLRRLDIATATLELMMDWQDYNRRTNNSLPWDRED